MKQHNKHGEASSGPSKEDLEEERKTLQEIISNYDIEDVFNCDETGEFIKIEYEFIVIYLFYNV